jgi:S-adenosylmethionine decarboxylase
MHLTIDGFGGNPELLASDQLVSELLNSFPERIGMTKIAAPHVQRYIGDKPDDWGVSGFVLIAESHIAIHSFPERGYVWADIFSCKGFDIELAQRIVTDAFQVIEVQRRVLERGLEYPHVVRDAIPLAEEERRAVTKELTAVGEGV